MEWQKLAASCFLYGPKCVPLMNLVTRFCTPRVSVAQFSPSFDLSQFDRKLWNLNVDNINSIIRLKGEDNTAVQN